MIGAIYVLFFLSGLSGLIYQVVWVRVFGTVFGSTVYSAATVTAVFMLGLGVGSVLISAAADRRRANAPERLISDYGYLELAIGLLGITIAFILPHLDRVSARLSSYVVDAQGWHVLSWSSWLLRSLACVLLVAPITIPMGATLTVLVRFVMQNDLRAGSGRLALLYGVNTLGAAAGALLTDYLFVPMLGLRLTQSMAAFLNFAAAASALGLGMLLHSRTATLPRKEQVAVVKTWRSLSIGPASLALAFSSLAAMGMEIVWFRHFTLLLGPLRSVYAMLLAVVLLGIAMGSLAGGVLNRRTNRSAEWFIAIQGLFIAATLWGIRQPSTRALADAAIKVGQHVDLESAIARYWAELWFNARPILLEALLPAVLMGTTFPLANALEQRDDSVVGRRVGALYLASTCGAVCGALVTGFVLIPRFGLQASATELMVFAWLGSLAMALAASRVSRRSGEPSSNLWRPALGPVIVSSLLSAAALGLWLLQPPRYVLERSLIRPSADEQLLGMKEGVNEVVAATEFEGDHRRWLLTNGYGMSSTGPMEQRYMRALAHIPLLSIDRPENVLVIGYGVGNTTHAAVLHRSVRHVEVADLSREILDYSPFFVSANHDVLHDGRVSVFVNDGRHHLQMQPEGTYDLIALEPPPITHAGVGALYSTEFYAVARSRLKEGGFISQWLPAYQVPSTITLSIVRAFLDVFPEAVLLSGAQPNLLLLGTKNGSIAIDPDKLEAALHREPEVTRDLERVDLGSVREIIGTFVGSAQTLQSATQSALPVTDDRPLQEYTSRSLINFGLAGVPASIIDLRHVDQWCPRCFAPEASSAAGLDSYMAVLGSAYMVPTRTAADFDSEDTRRMIAGSQYLRLLLRNAATARNEMGMRLAAEGRVNDATEQFREALRMQPGLDAARQSLAALERQSAVQH
jgi:predicted membrane-bound spermidine synthase